MADHGIDVLVQTENPLLCAFYGSIENLMSLVLPKVGDIWSLVILELFKRSGRAAMNSSPGSEHEEMLHIPRFAPFSTCGLWIRACARTGRAARGGSGQKVFPALDAHSQGCHVLEKLQGSCQMEKTSNHAMRARSCPENAFLVNIEEERHPKRSVSDGEWFRWQRVKKLLQWRLSGPGKHPPGRSNSRAAFIQGRVSNLSSIMLIGETAQDGERLERWLWGLSEQAGVLCGAVAPVRISAARAFQLCGFQSLNELPQLLRVSWIPPLFTDPHCHSPAPPSGSGIVVREWFRLDLGDFTKLQSSMERISMEKIPSLC